MAQGITSELLWIACVVWLIGFVFLRRCLGFWRAFFVASIKSLIPLGYFAFFYDKTWNFLDDITYMNAGTEMLRSGLNPWTALTTTEGLTRLAFYAEGIGILYWWWNLLAQFFFGESYYAPVFLNVAMTCLAGAGIAGLFKNMGFSKAYQRTGTIFYLLHIELLVWSSFVNLKDILVQVLLILSLNLLTGLFLRFRTSRLILLLLLQPPLMTLRFYTPVILFASAMAWLFLVWRSRWKYVLLPTLLVLFALFFPWTLIKESFIRPESFLFGVIQYPLTPQPWSIDTNYTFLILPSIIHWILFLPVIFMGLHLWQTQRLARLPLLVLIITTLLYSILPEIRGPRQRVQVSFVFIWLQFHFFWTQLTSRKPTPTPTPHIDAASEHTI